jgi:hypothetical protein
MKTTGQFTIHRVEVEAKFGEPIRLIPFGDIHRDSDMHAHRHWQEFLAYAKKQKNALFLGLGDYTDGVSTSERIVLNDPGLHDTTKRTLDDVYKGVARTLANELGFMRGRCLGLLGGNHYFAFPDGQTTDHLLAHHLGCRFLGVSSLLRVAFRFGKGNHHAHLDIFAHHGKGGGGLPGSQFNTIEKMSATAEADIYLMGHTHAKGCIPSSPRLRLHNTSQKPYVHLNERTPWLGRTGSFLKSYEPDRVSYNVDAGRSACALGWIEFEITYTRTERGGHDRIECQIRGTS